MGEAGASYVESQWRLKRRRVMRGGPCMSTCTPMPTFCADHGHLHCRGRVGDTGVVEGERVVKWWMIEEW